MFPRYPVVGVLEEMNATLAVMEDKLPEFFKDAHEIYYEQLHGKKPFLYLKTHFFSDQNILNIAIHVPLP